MLTGACGDFPDPFSGALTYQFPLGWVNASALLVAGQSGSSCDELSIEAAEKEVFRDRSELSMFLA